MNPQDWNREYRGIINNRKLIAFLEEWRARCQPESVYLCDGSAEENARVNQYMVDKKVWRKLNEKKKTNSYHINSDPRDTARSEASTFICTSKKEDAGPTNNWAAPKDMRNKLNKVYTGCMKGRTMYIIPFSMGPVGSRLARIGVQITDSLYVVSNNYIMTRMGQAVLDVLGENGEFVRCVHSVGSPIRPGQKDVAWPCNIENRYITHFPETREIISYGSGYGGNALLGKKCLALRIASFMARDEGDALAEHMLIMGLTNTEGKKYYLAAAFPSACGKTNLAMMEPSVPGWKVDTVGDDIAWLKLGKDGRMYAINPEAGFFGVAPGTSMKSNPSAMRAVQANSIFTNVAYTEDGDVWWEGMSKELPDSKILTWDGKWWSKGEPKPARFAHPNSRFTAPLAQCPTVDPAYDDPNGVPISAIVFGGRREKTVPLVFESRSWAHGVLIGSSVASERTAAAEGKVGELRFDPYAMLPFCGYNMADYWGYWLTFPEKTDPRKLPKIFHVNWFRKENDEFIWPGFCDNIRVLDWICQRCDNKPVAKETPIGYVPLPGSIDIKGLDITPKMMEKLLVVDAKAYLEEIPKVRNYHAQFGNRLPKRLVQELNELEQRLKRSMHRL